MIERSFLSIAMIFGFSIPQTTFSQGDLSVAATGELFPIGDTEGVGVDLEYLGRKFALGTAFLVSRDEKVEVHYPLRVLDYRFRNYQLSGQLLCRFRQKETHGGELGFCYSYFRSKVDYLDWFPTFYRFQYNGNYDMHFAGVMMGGRQFLNDRLFFVFHFRYLIQLASFEYPSYKLVAIYDPTWIPDESMKMGRSYFTIKVAFGMLLRKRSEKTNATPTTELPEE
jgi:hypothetical protein